MAVVVVVARHYTTSGALPPFQKSVQTCLLKSSWRYMGGGALYLIVPGGMNQMLFRRLSLFRDCSSISVREVKGEIRGAEGGAVEGSGS